MGLEYFVNADFDLSLRRGWDPSRVDARSRQARNLPMHFLLLGSGGDSVLLPERPSNAFLTYLEHLDLPCPSFNVLPAINRDARFTPFGWNREAAAFAARYREPASHPPLEVIRRVNGRRFAAALENDLFDDSHVLGEFSSVNSLCSFLAERPSEEEGWILKADHGNAGLGNRRLRARFLSETDLGLTRRFLTEDDHILLERWRPRVLDISSTFDLSSGGEVQGFDVHEVVNTADGAFIGVVYDRDSPAIEPWRHEMREAAGLVADQLVNAGYFGPVCIDAFIWQEAGTRRLRPLVDLNARMHVSAPVRRLWRRWCGERVFYWRFFSGRKVALPEEYGELETVLGEDAFDRRTRRGILLTSPLRVDEGGRRSSRFGVLLSGSDRAEIEAMDHRFRERFER
jgi:hypothetical protein